jgi:hypothetical protein
VLHNFDKVPTAAVVTRATRLRSYLAKRIARGASKARTRVAPLVSRGVFYTCTSYQSWLTLSVPLGGKTPGSLVRCSWNLNLAATGQSAFRICLN